MESVDEKKQIVIALVFKDVNGNPAIPTKVKYRVADVPSLTQIIGNTEINNPGSATVEITVTALQNAILNSALQYETRLLSLEWYSGATLIGSKQYYYKVKNLVQIPLSAYD